MAVGAEMGSSTGQGDLLDGVAAERAGLTGTAVHAQCVLVSPLLAFRVAVVPEGRSAMLEPLAEDFGDGFDQFVALGCRNGRELPCGVNAPEQEGFVRVNVPQASQDRPLDKPIKKSA